MQCPYCRVRLTESSKECPSCQLSLRSASALLSPMPHYGRGLSDRQKALDKNERKKVSEALAELTKKFPQVDMHVVTQNFDNQYPMPTHLFWLFNEGGFCPEDRKGGKNHTILLGIDVKQGRSGLIPGYGLEPFLPMKALDHTLEKAQPLLAAGDHGKAIITVIVALDELMSGICENIEQNLGITLETTAGSTEF